MATLFDRYPRTLYEWLKTDDKVLKASVADGKTVLEAAEALQREPVSVLRRLDQLALLPFVEHSEEWVEVMSLALAEVPLEFVISWCTADDERLPYEVFSAFATRDLRTAFELAREHRIIVANEDALDDLVWLTEQDNPTRMRYAAAALALTLGFDVVTPQTLKRQILGLPEPTLPRARSTSTKAVSRARRRRAPASTTSHTIYARKGRGRYSSKKSTAYS